MKYAISDQFGGRYVQAPTVDKVGVEDRLVLVWTGNLNKAIHFTTATSASGWLVAFAYKAGRLRCPPPEEFKIVRITNLGWQEGQIA